MDRCWRRWRPRNPKGRLIAWDPVAGREAWRVPHPVVRSGGTLSTAGNLVFQGRVDGVFAAYRATDGQLLWQFDAGVGIAAGPMTYAVGDTQYVAVLNGPPAIFSDPGSRAGPGRLLVFALGGERPSCRPRLRHVDRFPRRRSSWRLRTPTSSRVARCSAPTAAAATASRRTS